MTTETNNTEPRTFTEDMTWSVNPTGDSHHLGGQELNYGDPTVFGTVYANAGRTDGRDKSFSWSVLARPGYPVKHGNSPTLLQAKFEATRVAADVWAKQVEAAERMAWSTGASGNVHHLAYAGLVAGDRETVIASARKEDNGNHEWIAWTRDGVIDSRGETKTLEEAQWMATLNAKDACRIY